MNHIVKTGRFVIRNKALFSTIQKVQNTAPSKRQYLQFSKQKLVDFGQLPFGQIPDALKYKRPSSLKKLSNGVRVATHSWPGYGCAITVTIKAGTRQQDLSNSSVSQFISRLALKGTSSYSKDEIQKKIDSFGGNVEVSVTRELTQFSLMFDKSQLNEAVAFMSEVILKPTFEASQVQAEKANIYKDATSLKDPQRISHQNIHYTSFRDHYLGQPSWGIRDNIYSITPQQIKQFHNKFYVGQNIVVSGAGQINQTQFQELANQYFGNAPAEVIGQVSNKQQPFFTPSLMFQRDDQIYNTTVSVGFLAPSWNDPDFFAMSFFRRIIGQYRVDKYTGAHLNTSHQQYNRFHTEFGQYPDIIAQRPFFFSYSDTGLFGNFLYGNQVFNRELLLLSQYILSSYAQYIPLVEVFRARNRYWNELLERNNPFHMSWANSIQVAYLDRLISRTQIATRISNMDPATVSKIATKWFWDKEISVTAWGPLHNMMANSHYNRPYKRSTLGQYSMVGVKAGY